jgi:hypothetical protein
MAWMLGGAGGLGILLGLHWRVPALLTVCWLAIPAALGVQYRASFSVLAALGLVLALAATLQVGFLLGLALSTPWMPLRRRFRAHIRDVGAQTTAGARALLMRIASSR